MLDRKASGSSAWRTWGQRPPKSDPCLLGRRRHCPSKIATDSPVVESARSDTSNKKSKSVDQIYLEILKDFKDAGKPKTLTSLEKRVQWRLGPEPAPEKVAEVLAALEREREIQIAEGTIEYRDHVTLNCEVGVDWLQSNTSP